LLISLLSMFISTQALAEILNRAECENGTFTVSVPTAGELGGVVSAKIHNAEIGEFFGRTSFPLFGLSDWDFSPLVAPVETFESGEPRSIFYMYRERAGLRIIYETRPYREIAYRWTDSNGYTYVATCHAEPRQRCTTHGTVIADRTVLESTTANWFFQ